MTSLRYVPHLLLSRMNADGGGLPSGPRADACSGVLLFADITGFTELMTRQTDLGRAGMEAFASSLNGYFGELIERITAAGGDVVTFAGDALLALFQPLDEGGSLEASVRAAQACAAGIQRDLHMRDVGGGVRLSMRITISAGSAYLAQVGGLGGRWEIFLTGDVTKQIAPALRRASAGQVSLSEQAMTVIGVAPKKRVDDPGAPSSSRAGSLAPSASDSSPDSSRRSSNPPSSRATEAALTTFVPTVVQLWTGREEFIGQVRTVTTCFVRLPDVDLSKPEALAATDAQVRRVQEIVERYEGELNKVFADEKGLAAVLAWGLPTRSHEDDAARAIGAARALDDAFRRDGVELSIGIATGAVYCGEIGNEMRCEYALLGTPVNIAARLMQAAAGSILCDSMAAQAARASYEFSAPKSRSLKGMVRPVMACSPLSPRGARESRSAAACIGREAEISLVERSIRRMSSDGRGAVVMVEAEAGMGKSTLLGAFMAKAQSAAFRVFFGEARAIEKRVSYHPFRTVIAEVLGLRSSTDLDEIPRLLAGVGRGDAWIQERAPLLAAILPVALPATPFVSELASDQARADNLHALVVRLIEKAAARAPLALVFDDVHWFDSTSWKLLRALVRSLPQALFALGSRPNSGAFAEEYEALRDDPSTLKIELGGLDDAELIEMVRRELGAASLPPALQAMLTTRSEGNPFYAIELSLALRDKGLIAVIDGRCSVTTADGALSADVLPATIQGLVHARFDSLSADEQLFLKVASVLGRSFHLSDVEGVLPQRGADPEVVAARLVAADMLRPEGGPGSGAYEFRHALACDAIYDSMLLAQRRELHSAAVEHLEASAVDIAPSHGVLAYHARRAEDWERATRYLELAAEDALARSANAECRKHVEGAIEIVEQGHAEVPSAQIAGWHWRASVAAFRMGTMDACIEHGRAALVGYGVALPKRALGGFAEITGAALRRTRGARPSKVPGADLEPEARARVLEIYHLLVDAFGYKLDAIGIMTAILRQMDLAEAIADVGSAAHARLMLYFVLSATPFAPKARGWVAECEATLDAPMDPQIRASLHTRLVAAHTYVGAFREAEQRASEAVNRAWEAGEMRVFGDAAANSSHALHAQGRYAETEPILRRLVEIGRLTGNMQFEVVAVIGLGDCSARLGRAGEMRARVEEHGAWIEAHAMAADFVYEQGVRALLALVTGDRAASIELADKSVSRAAREPFPVWWMLQGLCGSADVYRALAAEAARERPKEAAALRSKLAQAVAQLRRFAKAFAFGALFPLYYDGLVDELAGKPARAQRKWREALAHPQAEGTRYVRARMLRALGRSLGHDSPEGRQASDLGESILAELGAVEPEPPA